MPFSRSREGATLSVLTAIIRGEAWTASTLRNPVLRKNYRRLNRSFCRSNAITDSLREGAHRLLVAVVARSELLSCEHRHGRHLVIALLRVASYSDRWIRCPESWSPSGGDEWRDLLNHLFVRWELPEFFESAWFEKGELRYLERDWYCDIAAGASWRKLAGVPVSVSSKAVYFAMKAPGDLTVRQALRWGQLKAQGASSSLIDEVLQSCVVGNLSNDDVWSILLAKVTGNPSFRPEDFGMIADVFQSLYLGYQFNRARDLVGLPLHDLLHYCRKYWERLLTDALKDELKFSTHDVRSAGLRRDLEFYTNAWWDPMEHVHHEEIRHKARNGRETVWMVRQLVRHSQLIAEGLAMNHCVGGYRQSCRRKHSAIFSVAQLSSEVGEIRFIRKVTVEVYRKKRMVVQAKRNQNDPPSDLELEIISKWASANRLLMRIG